MICESTSDVRYRKDVIIVAGQSNAVGYRNDGYLSLWPVRQAQLQPSIVYCRKVYSSGIPDDINNTVLDWGAMAPYPTVAPRGHLAADVALAALNLGWQPAIIHCGQGSTTCTQWHDSLCATYCDWAATQLAKLVSPVVRGIIYDGGANDLVLDPTGAEWADGATGAPYVLNYFRTICNQPTMRIVNICVPRTYDDSVAHPGWKWTAQFGAAQEAIATTMTHCATVEDRVSTFFADHAHIDAPSSMRVATLAVNALATLQ
jgi:hypothetical protein